MAKHVLPVRMRPASVKDARNASDDYGTSDSPNWREVDWRSHLHSIEVAGRSLNYVDIGEGDAEPVVFVHGLGGCWQNWLENIPRIAQGRRVIALDLPGFGHSEMPRGDVSVSGFGRTVDELADRLDLGQVAVVGNSMGGFTGAEMAIQFPGRVERLVLVSAAGISIVDLRREPVLALSRVLAGVTARTAAMRPKLAARPRTRHMILSAVARHPSRLKPDITLELMRGAGSPGFVPALEALTSYDFRDRLGDIRCPTLIVWGEKDALVPLRDAEEFQREIPNSRKVVFNDTGHVGMIERPRAFNDCLEQFLGEQAGELMSEAQVEESAYASGGTEGSRTPAG